jgi:hypothetical protein
VTVTAGGTPFTLLGSVPEPGFIFGEIFYLPNVDAGLTSVTVSNPAGTGASPCIFVVAEYSGAISGAAMYGFAAKTAHLTTGAGMAQAISGIGVAPSSTNDLVLVAFFVSANTMLTSGDGFTVRPSQLTSALLEETAAPVATSDQLGTAVFPSSLANFYWSALAAAISGD